MNQTQKGVHLPTTPSPKMYEVPLEDGTVWTGTKRQLLEEHPDWKPYAREIPQPTRSTRAPTKDNDDVETLIEQVEQDFQDQRDPGRLPTSSRKYAPLPGIGQRGRYEARPEVLQAPIQQRRSAAPAPHRQKTSRKQTRRDESAAFCSSADQNTPCCT